MATRSTIAIMKEDGSIDSIYCHNDGYFSNNGFLLYMYYQDPELIKKMISLGSMSSLEKSIDPISKTHHFDNRDTDVCVFYHRDRGEDLHIAQADSLDEFIRIGNYESYIYIYQESKRAWYYLNDDNKLKPLYGAVSAEVKQENQPWKLNELQTMREKLKQDKIKINLAKKLTNTLPEAKSIKQRKI